MTAALVFVGGYLAVLAVVAWKASQQEKARHLARMYDGRRPSGWFDADPTAAARLDYFARTAPDSEIRAAVRLHESAELDEAAARVVAELAAEESKRRKAAAEEEGAS